MRWRRILTWGRRVPASALPSWGSMPQLGNKKMYCICLSRHRALTSKCRRGDASPPGEDALPAGEDAFLTRAYVRVHNIYLERFLFHVSFLCHNALIINTFKRWNNCILCFIFDFNVSVVFLPLGFDFSPIEVLNRSHWGLIFLRVCFFGKGCGK